MAIVKTNKEIDVKQQEEKIRIQFVCPVCKKEKTLMIKKLMIDQSKQLLTISIPKNQICPHHFQAFVDKNCKVRGYQKVDFSFEQEPDINLEKKTIIKNHIREDYELFKNLILKANTVEYIPNDFIKVKKPYTNLYKKDLKKQKINNELSSIKQKAQSNMRKDKKEKRSMTLQEIYEEFWEFIDENNHEFREFIIKDPRKTKKP